MGLSFADWFVGFTDGEGSFQIFINKFPKLKYGIQFRVGFFITQYDLNILRRIHDFFGFGGMTPLSNKPGFYYAVTSINDCLKLVDFFDKNPLQSKKINDYKIWRECVFKIKNLEHRTEKGILEIVKLREKINSNSKSSRRLCFEEIKKTIEKKTGQKLI